VLVLLKNKYKHQIEIIKNYSNNLPVVECYPGKLNQVFMNIINNAIDAIGGKPGKISITTGCTEDMVSISISDNGKGIPESDLVKIFDPFFTTKEVGYGMGLGLAISYSIIQEHNGKIEVKSVVGQGTEFLLTFPIIQIK
jgi:signal transduction histidine kinase